MAWLKGANRPGAGSAPISTSRRSRAASRRETARRNSAGSATVVDTIILATIRRLSRAGGTPRRPMRVDGSVGGACPCLGYGAAARAPAPSGRAQGADVGHAGAEAYQPGGEGAEQRCVGFYRVDRLADLRLRDAQRAVVAAVDDRPDEPVRAPVESQLPVQQVFHGRGVALQ